jgi:hypothetical protein
VCIIHPEPSATIAQLKSKISVEGGLNADTLALYLSQNEWPLGESTSLEVCGMPSELYAVVLHKVNVATDIAGTSPHKLNDAQLVSACSTTEVQGGDIIVLKGCRQLRDVSCVLRLEQMQELDLSGCPNIEVQALAAGLILHKGLSKITFGQDPVTVEISMNLADFSGKRIGPSGGCILAALLPKCQDLSLINVMGNRMGTEQLSKLQEIMRSRPSLISLCGIADDATEADLSGLGMDAADAIVLAVELPNKGALSSMNLLCNCIGIEQAQHLVTLLKEHPTLKSLCGNTGDETELDMSGKKMAAADVTMLRPEIIGNRSLLRLSLADNNLRAEGCKALAQALKGNSVITELNISNNHLVHYDKSAIADLIDAIKDMGVLSKFTFSGDGVHWGYNSKPVTMEVSMAEADMSGAELGVSGAMLLAGFLPKCQ